MRIIPCLAVFLFAISLVSASETCQSLGNPENCIELIPGQSGTHYTYLADHDTYVLGNTDSANYYFLLMGDMSCDKTCIVPRWGARKDTQYTTTIDLNGFTLTYSAAGYDTLKNNGFELWSGNNPIDWTVISGVVEPRSTSYHQPMSGDWVLYTPGSVIIESSFMNLPLANRQYQAYVTVGRASSTDIVLEVVDAANTVVCSRTRQGFFRGQTIGCSFTAPHTGQYKLRITTQGYAYVDMTGIVPTSDYGIVGGSSYDLNVRLRDNYPGYTFQGSWDTHNIGQYNDVRPILEVKNGNMRTGAENVDSYAIRTSAAPMGFFHDLDIRTKGMKSHTIRTGGRVMNNYLEVDMPWYYARESSIEENVIISGQLVNNTLIGGQGVVRLQGSNTLIEGNYLRNNAQATNHYAIIQSGASNPIIRNNIFDPIEGSGILTYTGGGYRIYNNTFYVRTATCNVEYINEDYSTNAIRMNDYGSQRNTNNWIYDNDFYITGIQYQTAWSNCLPVTTGIFYSANGPDNRIFNNRFYINDTNPNNNHPVIALYVGGGADNNPEDNPLFVNNYFETNNKAIWLATYYGATSHIWLENNTFARVPNDYFNSPEPDAAIRMGRGSSNSINNRFINNNFLGGFDPHAREFTAVNSNALYDIHQQGYVFVTVVDQSGNELAGAQVSAYSPQTGESDSQLTNSAGRARLTLTEYVESGDMRPSGVHNREYVTPHNIYVTYEDLTEVIDMSVSGEEEVILIMPLGGSCSPDGSTRQCGIDVGVCQKGVQTCIDGYWSACIGSINPSPEVCDGQDNNCNGLVDENLGTTTCGVGVCLHTIDNCVGGVPQVCNPFEGQLPESPLVNCGNGIDESCSGYDVPCGFEIVGEQSSGGVECIVNDPLGVGEIVLLDVSENVVARKQVVSGSFAFLEVEHFDYNPNHWNVCPNSASQVEGNNCESNRAFSTNVASGLAHAVTRESGGGQTPMAQSVFFIPGNYYVWARSWQGADSRRWQLGVDGQLFELWLGGLGTSRFAWELVGTRQLSGEVIVSIHDPLLNNFWSYPDAVLFTTDASFDPIIACGVSASSLHTSYPYQYGLATCGLSEQVESTVFEHTSVPDVWECGYVNSEGALVTMSGSIPPSPPIPGDINGDGIVNFSDLFLVTSLEQLVLVGKHFGNS